MVCFKDQQLFDLVRFGCCEKYYSIVNFDTTFNLVIVTMKFLCVKFISICERFKRTSDFHGSSNGSYEKKQIKYHSDILFKYEEFSVTDLKLIITDDDEALNGALKKSFENTDFVFCCNQRLEKTY
ncbi:hypothetical protein BpHYR1_033587 [Brachionus plicatilis]|uniref:Uncharacterized protein n=1 Tax=Brachionus plicatilis TaxID=10195 RepID=A0A3M7RJ85_BRAPC|nr:hypothetical protein BpHYR1_033587 [Brachionus plicatilis]